MIFPEDKGTYAISYLSGNETDNPVYFEGEEEPCMADSEIIFDEEEETNLFWTDLIKWQLSHLSNLLFIVK